MHSKWNNKINQVTENTLVVGMDIAKRIHYACFVDERGRVIEKAFAVHQSKEGFENLYEKIRQMMKEAKKTEVIIGIEPTGHYWMNLAYFLDQYGIPLVMVNPMHVKRSKELDDNLPTKNDKKDALVIARLLKDGRFSYPRILKEVEAELRIGSTLRLKLTEDLASIKNRIIRWLDRYFPEFTQVFPTFGKMALTALERTPMPQDIQGKTAEELVFFYRQVGGMRAPQLPKAKLLIEKASNSIGLTEGQKMAKHEIATLLRQFRLLETEIEAVNDQLTELAKTTMEYDLLASVPGLGDATIVDLLSEVGSFSLYENPRQLIKLAGLTLRENSSGQHKGQKHISKRGRKRLRHILFKVIVPLIRHNLAFKQLHEYYTTRNQNPLRGKQSMVVLCGKLLKILHGICKKKVYFNEQLMMKDLYSLGEAA
ncbi:IS110 family transposase [Solibacillus sp. R5-41]|uniref:IS110 family transposase n=1 Tax=Solibacillus sp. R5-41 TaxID=2048654 RepID=UPI000C1292C2|nr:IS110 family transposase [Solibacillus sp. R5-41]ATP40283.1 IS110 family transposase [Solibacillus sp. R5-41]ATP40348.1 IS110 family transposase [Solibacillus sp. R5-41]ATP40357.1 IS110 family transposase [Solibacillus sp. R5-41]ATP40387.1 IS110 family transposase [Solibacillus sp. R5-41]ATP40797.1 IS110 family transposase [Solibacillus sp. R5-41]